MKSTASTNDDFGGIPAWRVKQLRAKLNEAAERGLNCEDKGDDLQHRAERLLFERSRRNIYQEISKRAKQNRDDVLARRITLAESDRRSKYLNRLLKAVEANLRSRMSKAHAK